MMNQQIHQKSWIRTIAKTGKWYLLSSIFTKGLSVFLLPIYTRYLDPSEFGILNTLTAVGSVLQIAVSIQLDSAFGRYFHQFKNDDRQLAALFSTIYWFVFSFGSVVITFALGYAALFPETFSGTPFSYLALTFVPALFLQLGQLGMVFLRQSLDSVRTTVLEIAGALISVGITLPLLIELDYGVMARLLGGAAAAVAAFGYYTIHFARRGILRPIWDTGLLRRSLAYSLPLVPSVAGGWIAGLSDRLIAAHYIDYSAVGVYSVAANLATAMYVLQDAITQVIGPLAMSGLVSDRAATLVKMRNSAEQMWALMLYANFGLMLFSKELIWIFSTNRYASASALIGIIGFAYVLGCQYRNFASIISLHNKTWILTFGGIIQAIVSVALNFQFMNIYGISTAAWSLCISTFVFSIWLYYWSWKLDGFRLKEKSMLSCFLIFLVLALLCEGYFAPMQISFSLAAEKLVLVLSIPLLTFYAFRHRIPFRGRL